MFQSHEDIVKDKSPAALLFTDVQMSSGCVVTQSKRSFNFLVGGKAEVQLTRAAKGGAYQHYSPVIAVCRQYPSAGRRRQANGIVQLAFSRSRPVRLPVAGHALAAGVQTANAVRMANS